jgi:hypothetical protein
MRVANKLPAASFVDSWNEDNDRYLYIHLAKRLVDAYSFEAFAIEVASQGNDVCLVRGDDNNVGLFDTKLFVWSSNKVYSYYLLYRVVA